MEPPILRRTGKSSREILQLVQVALDEFESVPLSASARRALRIATLLGETETVMRLVLELRPRAGHKPSNRADVIRMVAEDGALSPDQAATYSRVLDAFIEDRELRGDGEGRITGHALEEIEFWHRELPASSDVPDEQFQEFLARTEAMNVVTVLLRQRTFAMLCGWERQLTFTATNDAILGAHQERVDAVLGAVAPDVLDQFNMVFRRLNEATETDSSSIASELLSQAVTSCRRVLKAVVDVVQPVDPTKPETDDGHVLNDSAYKNRLFEFLKSATTSGSFSKALSAASNALWERFAAIDALSSKGVHAEVAREEAELCALNSYLLAGEVLQMHRRSDVAPAVASSSETSATE